MMNFFLFSTLLTSQAVSGHHAPMPKRVGLDEDGRRRFHAIGHNCCVLTATTGGTGLNPTVGGVGLGGTDPGAPTDPLPVGFSHGGYTLVGDGVCVDGTSRKFDKYNSNVKVGGGVADGSVDEATCKSLCDAEADCHSFSWVHWTINARRGIEAGVCSLFVNQGLSIDTSGAQWQTCNTLTHACWGRIDADAADPHNVGMGPAAGVDTALIAGTQCWKKDAWQAPAPTPAPISDHSGYTHIGTGKCVAGGFKDFDHYRNNVKVEGGVANGGVDEPTCKSLCDSETGCHSFSWALWEMPRWSVGVCTLNVNQPTTFDLTAAKFTTCDKTTHECWGRIEGDDRINAPVLAVATDTFTNTQCWRKNVAPLHPGYLEEGSGDCRNSAGSKFDRYNNDIKVGGGRTDGGVSQNQCRTLCNGHDECHSFSWTFWQIPTHPGLKSGVCMLNVNSGATIDISTAGFDTCDTTQHTCWGRVSGDAGAVGPATQVGTAALAPSVATCYRKSAWVPPIHHDGYTLQDGEGDCRSADDKEFDHYFNDVGGDPTGSFGDGAVSQNLCAALCNGADNCHSFSFGQLQVPAHGGWVGMCTLNVNPGATIDTSGFQFQTCSWAATHTCWPRRDGDSNANAPASGTGLPPLTTVSTTKCWKKDSFDISCPADKTIRGCCGTAVEAMSRVLYPSASMCLTAGVSPHIRQFDGAVNHAKDEGDYWMYQSPSDANGDHDISIAVRHEGPASAADRARLGRVAGNKAIGVSGKLLGGNKVELRGPGFGGDLKLVWNGQHDAFRADEICTLLEPYTCRCWYRRFPTSSYAPEQIFLQFEDYVLLLWLGDPQNGWMNVRLQAPAATVAQASGMCANTGIFANPAGDVYGGERIQCAEDMLSDRTAFCGRRRMDSAGRRRSVLDVLAQCPADLKQAATQQCGGCGDLGGMETACVFDACAMGSVDAVKSVTKACVQAKIFTATSPEAKAAVCEAEDPETAFDPDTEQCLQKVVEQASEESSSSSEDLSITTNAGISETTSSKSDPDDDKNAKAMMAAAWTFGTIMFVIAALVIVAMGMVYFWDRKKRASTAATSKAQDDAINRVM